MKYIAEHFGPALVAFAILIALATLIVGMLTQNGVIAQQFESALSSFFTSMQEVTGV